MLPYLSNYCLDTAQRNTLVIGTDDQFEQVVTQHLKHHANICLLSRLLPLRHRTPHVNLTQSKKISCLCVSFLFKPLSWTLLSVIIQSSCKCFTMSTRFNYNCWVTAQWESVVKTWIKYLSQSINAKHYCNKKLRYTAQLTVGPQLVYLRKMWEIDNVYFVEYTSGIIPFWLMLYTRLA